MEMTDQASEHVIEIPAETPAHGGSYNAQPDGSLILIERTKQQNEE